MITPEHARMMSRYNHWQNRSIVGAAEGLDDEARWRDRGAFFGSVAATLNHLYWGDRLWLARLAGRPEDKPHPHPYTDAPRDWAVYVRDRAELDDEIAAWADEVAQADLDSTLAWRPREGAARTLTRSFCAVQMFNHQIHHRGQVHAMLTAAGAVPEPTDVLMMPENG